MNITRIMNQNNLYICHAQSVLVNVNCVNYVQDDKTVFWHKRLVHMSNKGLKFLKRMACLVMINCLMCPFVTLACV